MVLMESSLSPQVLFFCELATLPSRGPCGPLPLIFSLSKDATHFALAAMATSQNPKQLTAKDYRDEYQAALEEEDHTEPREGRVASSQESKCGEGRFHKYHCSTQV